MERKQKYQLTGVIFTIVGITTIESLICWKSYSGCISPSKIGWIEYFKIYFCLLSGPISGFFTPIINGNALSPDWCILVSIVFIITLVPFIIYFYRKKGFILLGFGAIVWLASAWLFTIGIGA